MAPDTHENSKVQLDESLTSRIEALARTTGRPPAEILRAAVEEFADRLNGARKPGESKRLWEIAAEISASIPDEEWAKLPTDLARNFEHHRYGYPREE